MGETKSETTDLACWCEYVHNGVGMERVIEIGGCPTHDPEVPTDTKTETRVPCGAVSEHEDVCGLPHHDSGLCQSDGPRKHVSSPEKASKPWFWYRDAAVAWNAAHPVGTPVLAWPGTRDDEPLTTRTRTPAWTLGHGAAVVSVEGRSGGIALTHIQPLEPSGAASDALGAPQKAATAREEASPVSM